MAPHHHRTARPRRYGGAGTDKGQRPRCQREGRGRDEQDNPFVNTIDLMAEEIEGL